jgi:hypothetical protein
LRKPAKEKTKILMMDATHLKVHRTAVSLKKGGFTAPDHIGRTKGGLGSKLHALCDGLGRPMRLLLTAGNGNDIVGAGELLKDLPEADYLLSGRWGCF